MTIYIKSRSSCNALMTTTIFLCKVINHNRTLYNVNHRRANDISFRLTPPVVFTHCSWSTNEVLSILWWCEDVLRGDPRCQWSHISAFRGDRSTEDILDFALRLTNRTPGNLEGTLVVRTWTSKRGMVMCNSDVFRRSLEANV